MMDEGVVTEPFVDSTAKNAGVELALTMRNLFPAGMPGSWSPVPASLTFPASPTARTGRPRYSARTATSTCPALEALRLARPAGSR